MVTELVALDVKPGQEADFEAAFDTAKTIIASASGFVWLRLERCLEHRSRYVLLVGWERLEDHMEGFRGSEAYSEWRALLHHFYDPVPTVAHYSLVAAEGAEDG